MKTHSQGAALLLLLSLTQSRPAGAQGSNSTGPSPPGLPAAISGTISRGPGTAAANVTVTLTGAASQTATTDANGDFRFPSVPVGGPYTVTFSRSGYSFTPSQVTIPSVSGAIWFQVWPWCASTLGLLSNFPYNGATIGTPLTRTAGCAWTATAQGGFTSVTPTSGSGGNTLQVTAQPQWSAWVPRTASMTAGDLSTRFIQAPASLEPLYRFNDVWLE